MKKIFFMLVVILIASNSFAGSMCSMTPGVTSGFDTILNTYATITMKWAALIFPKAQTLFGILFALEFLWQVTVKKILAFDIQKLYVFFIVRIVSAPKGTATLPQGFQASRKTHQQGHQYQKMRKSVGYTC